MNKTVSIHLQGIPFIFEEQAFERLNTYLQQLKQVLQKEEGSDEILQDIELRMVELLQQQLTPFKQVVELSVIEQIIEKLGKPEDFTDESTGSNETSAITDEPIENEELVDNVEQEEEEIDAEQHDDGTEEDAAEDEPHDESDDQDDSDTDD
jgi:hypothetical protein